MNYACSCQLCHLLLRGQSHAQACVSFLMEDYSYKDPGLNKGERANGKQLQHKLAATRQSKVINAIVANVTFLRCEAFALMMSWTLTLLKSF